MKQLPHVSALLYCQPWAILPSVHAELSELYRSYLQGTLPALPESLEGKGWKSSGIGYEMDHASGIAVIHVEGIISKHAPDIFCGPAIADLAKLDALIEEISKLIPGGGIAGLLGLAGIGGIGYLVTSQAKGAAEAAMSYEQLQTRIEQYAGSAKKAHAILDDLREFEVKTMFDLPDLGAALSQLMGSGIGEGVGDLVKEIGAVSQSGQELRDLADALSKGFAKGKFQTNDINKFLQRGINLLPQLAAVTGKAGDELTNAIQAGLSFDDVREAIARMSREGGTHFGLLERMGATMAGRISTLTGAWDEFRRSFMQPVLDAVKPIVMELTERIEELIPKAEQFGKTLSNSILAAFAIIKSGKGFELLSAGFNFAITKAMDLLMRGLRGAVAFLATALPPIVEEAFAKIRDPQFWQGIGQLFEAVFQKLFAEINAALPGRDGVSESAAGLAESLSRHGWQNVAGAGSGANFTAAAAEAIQAGFDAAREAMSHDETIAMKQAREEIAKLTASVSGMISGLREKSAIPGVAAGASGAGEKSLLPGGDAIGAAVRQAISVTTSLGRIGGGGGGFVITPMVSEQKKANALLAQIKEKIAAGSKTPAVFS